MKQNRIIKEELLKISNFVDEIYFPKALILPEAQRPKLSWFDRNFLALLILLPTWQKKEMPQAAMDLAISLQFTYLAQQVHNLVPNRGSKEHFQQPILVGDFFFARSFSFLCQSGQINWLTPLSVAICKVNETRVARSRWHDCNFVTQEERLQIIKNEYGELPALAGYIGGTLAELPEEHLEALVGFSHYIGTIYGMLKEKATMLLESQMDLAKQYLLKLPLEMRKIFKKEFLDKFSAEYPELVCVYANWSNIAL